MFKAFIAVFVLVNLTFANCIEVEAKADKENGGVVCSICTVVLSAAQHLLEQNKTEAEVTTYIEKELCGRLGSLNSTCVQYVEAYGPTILYELGKKIDPSIVCGHIGLCATASVPKPPVFEPVNSLNCSLCKVVFTQVQDLLKNNVSDDKIIATIEAKLCNSTGTVNPLCKAFLDKFGPAILEYLGNDIDPTKLCQLIGMCPTHNQVTLPAMPMPVIEEVGNKPFCTACELIVQFADRELKENKTQTAVVADLEKICAIAPPSIRPECVSLVDTYGPYLIQLLVNFTDPSKVCAAAQLC